MLKDLNFVAQSNEDHQQRLKKRMINETGPKIFDLLLKYGSLRRLELAGLLETCEGSHKFSYALKDLRDKGLVDVASKTSKITKLKLTDDAFLNASEDRPKDTIELSTKESEYAVWRAMRKTKRRKVMQQEEEKIATKKEDGSENGKRSKKMKVEGDKEKDNDTKQEEKEVEVGKAVEVQEDKD